jgi:large subunit ribosomal protein L6
MTITGMLEQEIEIPEGISIQITGPQVIVKGPNGQLSRRLSHPRVKIKKTDSKVLVYCEFPRVKEKALVGTYAAHIRNMVYGAKNDFEYHMKIVYSHFPMKVNVRGSVFVIENFMGERSPRKANIIEGVKVAVKGSDVTVTGADVEAAGQTAANIEKATRIKGYDPRVFQDGIYIVVKGRRTAA